MSDGSIIIDVELNKTEFEAQVADLASVSKQATLAFAGAAAGAVAVGTAIWGTAKAAADAGERVKEMSARVGLSSQKFQEWDYILSQSGGNIESLGIGMKTLTEKMDAAKSGNEEATAAFRALGISVEDIKSKTREQIFEQVIRGLQNTSDESRRASVGADLLGRSFLDLAPALSMTNEETESLRQKAHELNLVFSEEMAKAGDDFKDALETLERVIARVAIAIGSEFVPALTRLMEWVATFVGNRERMEAMVEVFKLTMTAIAAASAGLAAYGVSLLVLNANLIVTTAAQWALNVAMTANPIGVVIALVVALGVALLLLSGEMGDFVGSMAGFFSEFLADASTCFSGVVAWLTSTIPAALSATMSSFYSFQTSLGTVFSYITERVNAMVVTMKAWSDNFCSSIKTVADYLATLPNLITYVLEGAWDAFTAGAASLIEKVGEVMLNLANTIINSIADLPSKMYNAGVNMVMSLWNGLRSQMEALISYLRQKMAEIASILSGGSTTTTTMTSSVSPSALRSVSPSFASVSAGSNVTFTQIINSPVALSPSEILREAENSMTLWGLK